MDLKLPLLRGWNRLVRFFVPHILPVGHYTCWNNEPLHGTRGPLHPSSTVYLNVAYLCSSAILTMMWAYGVPFHIT